jgi:hypothetical protein
MIIYSKHFQQNMWNGLCDTRKKPTTALCKVGFIFCQFDQESEWPPEILIEYYIELILYDTHERVGNIM